MTAVFRITRLPLPSTRSFCQDMIFQLPAEAARVAKEQSATERVTHSQHATRGNMSSTTLILKNLLDHVPNTRGKLINYTRDCPTIMTRSNWDVVRHNPILTS